MQPSVYYVNSNNINNKFVESPSQNLTNSDRKRSISNN